MTWTLLKQSFAILREDTRLLIFPVLSALAAVAVSAPYAWLLIGGFSGEPVTHPTLTAASWAILFAWYCSAAFVMIFFSCALAACAQAHFSGQEPSISYGLQRA